jgi:hypothetical protein
LIWPGGLRLFTEIGFLTGSGVLGVSQARVRTLEESIALSGCSKEFKGSRFCGVASSDRRGFLKSTLFGLRKALRRLDSFRQCWHAGACARAAIFSSWAALSRMGIGRFRGCHQ